MCRNTYARNVEVLGKSKDDIEVDTAEWTAAVSAMQHAFDPDIGGDNDMTEESEPINDSVDDDTLRLSYHPTRRRWAEADAIAAAKFLTYSGHGMFHPPPIHR